MDIIAIQPPPNKASMNNLPLYHMEERHHGLTKALADSYCEAASVCLERNHQSPQSFILACCGNEDTTTVTWNRPDDRIMGAWTNSSDATRDGAYACALAGVEVALDLYAVRRAETLSGADYYLGNREDSGEDLENQFRLEVSGTEMEDGEVRRRLRLKLQQLRKGSSNLPGIAAVVGFKTKEIMIQKVDLPT